MGDINLTSSMRSSLVSLQEIANRRSLAQIHLSTGQRINTAIDNPDIYYTASTLSSRINDLSQLLDNMSQGIQVLKAADDALSFGLHYLEQAKAVAQTTLDNYLKNNNSHPPNPPPLEPDFPDVPDDEPAPDFTDYIRVSTIDELNTALADSRTDKIVITQNLTFANNQKITIGPNKTLAALNNEITLNFSSDSIENNQAMITMANNATLENITINYHKTSDSGTGSAIYSENAQINLSGVIISTIGRSARGINATKNSTVSGSASISTNGNNGSDGLILHQSTFNGDININTYGVGVYAVNATVSSSINGKIQAATSGYLSAGIVLQTGSTAAGQINVISYGQKAEAIKVETNAIIRSDAIIHAYSQQNNALNLSGIIENGAQFYFADLGAEKMTGFQAHNIITDASLLIETGKNKSSAEFIDWMSKELNHTTFKGQTMALNTLSIAVETTAPITQESQTTASNYTSAAYQYNSILEQYNQLIKDAGYKGINLLQSQNLRINFNESRSSYAYVKGIDVSSTSLKITPAQWNNTKEIEQSLQEIEKAIIKIRSDSSNFNNDYFIVEKRNEYTEELINILTEGTDKLILADMNEESAVMLSLQTRESLAVNALSLASQSSTSILRLF